MAMHGMELVNRWESLPFPENQNFKKSLIEFLMSQRLANYGYSASDFRRLQRQRQRIKKVFARLLTLANLPSESRLSWDPTIGWTYCTGQSHNEEITNMMNRLCRNIDGLPLGESWLS